jgi:hypothetical protein
MRKRKRETIKVRKKTAKRKKEEDRRKRVTYKIQEKRDTKTTKN